MTKYVRSPNRTEPRVLGVALLIVRLRSMSLPQWNLILLSILAVLIVAYFIAVNRTSTATFDKLGLEERISATRAANQELQLQTLEYRSLSRIREAAQAAGMVAVDTQEYLAPSGSGPVAVTP